MTTNAVLLFGVVGLIICAILLEARFRRGKSRSLASKFAKPHEAPTLGLEATDIEKVEPILRHNAALAAKTGAGRAQVSWTSVGSATSLPTQNDQAQTSR